jgi:phenylalanyl-tRNA synthetase beta chain
MANIKIPRKQFEKDIGKLDEKMKEKIALFGTPLESVDEKEIELEIFPNRPDMLSYHGFKRAFTAFLGRKKGLKKYKLKSPEKEYYVQIDSSVRDVRPHTVCAIVKNLKLNDEKIKEIIEVQEKLHSTIGRKRRKIALGIYPLEKIKLPIKYTAMEPDIIKFQPLESPKEMSGLEILQRHPAGKEYAHLLKGKMKFPVFLDSKNNFLSMPPIINSELTGRVNEKTKEIFIECSGFDLKTLKKCLSILVTMFSDMGGKIYQMKIKSKDTQITPNLSTEKMNISLENTNKLLGLELTEKGIKDLLEKMGHNYNSSKKEVEIASWRTDILHEVDLIEEVAIAYGYENFEPEIPSISNIGKKDKKNIIKSKVADILSGLGYLEVSNLHLTPKQDQFEKMGVPEKQEEGYLKVLDSKTENDILRKDLSHMIMKTFSRNIDSEYPQKIFELGKVFRKKNSKIIEEEKLALGSAPGNFTELRQALEYLEKMLGVQFKIKEAEKIPSHLIDGRTGDIFLENKKIGQIGEVHPKIIRNWKIKMPISLLEIDLKDIFKQLE